MKRTVAALLAAAALFALVPAEAADDPSGDASGLTAYAGLASIATPVLASAAATALTVAGGHLPTTRVRSWCTPANSRRRYR